MALRVSIVNGWEDPRYLDSLAARGADVIVSDERPGFLMEFAEALWGSQAAIRVMSPPPAPPTPIVFDIRDRSRIGRTFGMEVRHFDGKPITHYFKVLPEEGGQVLLLRADETEPKNYWCFWVEIGRNLHLRAIDSMRESVYQEKVTKVFEVKGWNQRFHPRARLLAA